MKALILALLLFLSGIQLKAQTNVIIGSLLDTSISSSLKRKPLGSYYGFERSALLIKKEEINLNIPMSLSKIAFLCDTVNFSASSSTPVKVFITETNDTLFSNPTSVQTEENNALLVFNGTVNAASFIQGNYTELPFTLPFVYSGTQNLKIVIETNAGGNGNESALSKGFAYSIQNDNRFQFWQQDNFAPTGIGTLQQLFPICKLSFDSVAACTGNPQAGNAVSSKNAVCNSETFTLSLINNSFASGLSYQWQNSIDGINWTSMLAGNNQSLTTTISDTTYFRCLLSCLTSIDTSTAVMVFKKEPTECYCSSLGGGCQGYSIDSLSIVELQYNNSSNGCGNTVQAHYSYYDLSSQFPDTLIAGQSYQLSCTLTGDNVAAYWIDFDRDGWFENYEFNSICTTSVTGTVYTKTFTVPVNSVNGKTSLRIRTRNKVAGMDSSMACTSFGSGETEDYRFTIYGGQNVSTFQNTTLENVNLFPNPANEIINLNFTNEFSGNIILLNPEGAKLIEKSIDKQSEIQVDISELSPGLYILIGQNRKGVILKRKIIKY